MFPLTTNLYPEVQVLCMARVQPAVSAGFLPVKETPGYLLPPVCVVTGVWVGFGREWRGWVNGCRISAS